jgi:hypothetical protein
MEYEEDISNGVEGGTDGNECWCAPLRLGLECELRNPVVCSCLGIGRDRRPTTEDERPLSADSGGAREGTLESVARVGGA